MNSYYWKDGIQQWKKVNWRHRKTDIKADREGGRCRAGERERERVRKRERERMRERGEEGGGTEREADRWTDNER